MDRQPSLEYLLGQENERKFNTEPKQNRSHEDVQTAEKNASLYDLMKMIQKIVTITMKDLGVEFVPDEGKVVILKPEEEIGHPYITYRLIERKSKGELKPRHRQTINEIVNDKGDERIGEVFGQKFACIVQFNILASVYDTAEQVMERFEDLIFEYTGYFKKNGVAEMIFHQQITDTNYDTFRETISVRNIQYIVEVEKLFVTFEEKIKEIETYNSLKEGGTSK